MNLGTTVRALAITLAAYALVFAVASVRYAPPRAAGPDAPVERFSAGRARDVDARLVADGATRFVGTEGNARGRAFVAAELARIGFTVETQRAMSCTYHGMCAPIVNVIGRLPGREPALASESVLMTAHYDSVPVSPGASDDGFGAAVVLEAARALAAGPRPRRSVLALVADGEEAGLLGSDAFVRQSPLAQTVRTTVNIDARGDRGPSVMFETSPGNAWLVAMMASHLERPVTTSLFYEVYQRMPNDTDFSVTKKIASGVNFANTGGIENYHTPRDTLEAADLGTLQHHGDHVLGMTRAFAEAEVGTRSDTKEDSVWFDVLAFGIVRWPIGWSLALALGGLALVLLQTVRAGAAGFDRGLMALFVAVPGAATSELVGWGLHAAGALPTFWIARPAAALASLHAAALLAVLGAGFALARRANPRALWSGVWIGWGVLGVVAAIDAPGTSYLFVVPTLAAGVVSALPIGLASAVPAIVASVLLLSLGQGLYDALGFVSAALLTIPTVLLATLLAPMLPGLPAPVAKWGAAALGGTAVIAGVVALVVPRFTPERPQRVNVVFRQGAADESPDEAQARAFVDASWGWARWGDPPPAMLAAIGHVDGEEIALPWSVAAPFAKVPRIDAPSPTFEVLGSPASASEGSDVRRVRARIRSPRGAPAIVIVLPTRNRVEVTVEGRTAFPRQVGATFVLGLMAVPSEGVVVEFAMRRSMARPTAGSSPSPSPSEAVPITILDRSPGVPPGTKAADAVRARPNEAVPTQDGDATVLTRRVTL